MEVTPAVLQLAVFLHLQAESDAQLALVLALCRRKRRHTWWVRPWLTVQRYGQYETLMQELLQLFAFSQRHCADCAELEVDMLSVRLPVRK